MSEQGWHGFLAAEDVNDWVVLHGGATAVFCVGSLSEAAHLAEAIAKAPGIAGAGVLLTLADTRVTVRLSRDIWNLEPGHVQLARTISVVAREQGAVPDRAAVQEVQVAIAAKRDAIDVGFWRAVLGYAPVADDNAVDPLGHGSTVWMQELDQAKPLRHAMHIDVSVAREHVETRLQAAVAAGGRVVDESNAPSHWTLADRAGNRVCVCVARWGHPSNIRRLRVADHPWLRHSYSGREPTHDHLLNVGRLKLPGSPLPLSHHTELSYTRMFGLTPCMYDTIKIRSGVAFPRVRFWPKADMQVAA